MLPKSGVVGPNSAKVGLISANGGSDLRGFPPVVALARKLLPIRPTWVDFCACNMPRGRWAEKHPGTRGEQSSACLLGQPRPTSGIFDIKMASIRFSLRALPTVCIVILDEHACGVLVCPLVSRPRCLLHYESPLFLQRQLPCGSTAGELLRGASRPWSRTTLWKAWSHCFCPRHPLPKGCLHHFPTPWFRAPPWVCRHHAPIQ